MVLLLEQVVPTEVKRSARMGGQCRASTEGGGRAVVLLARVVPRQRKRARAMPFERVGPAPRRCRVPEVTSRGCRSRWIRELALTRQAGSCRAKRVMARGRAALRRSSQPSPNKKLQLTIAFLASLGRRLQLNFSRSADGEE